MDQECDEADISPNDYTIMFRNIPIDIPDALNNDYDDDLKDFLEKNLDIGMPFKITEVNLCYKIQDYFKLRDKK